MIFNELYSAYYNAVARILNKACSQPLSRSELRRIVAQEAFEESLLNIEPALLDEKWQLLRPDGTTPIQNAPSMPLTLLQRRWLKAISLDPRIRLFSDAIPDDPDVEPLFRPEDIDVFDRYSDGDPFENEQYILLFRNILQAIRERTPLWVEALSSREQVNHFIMTPDLLEYSEKDDKFRVVGHGFRPLFVNLARITDCKPYFGKVHYSAVCPEERANCVIELELVDERNALERVLMHFAHFEKQAERIDDRHYRMTITYQKEDETELLIRILGFGPVVRVTAPDHFVSLVRERLLRQKKIL